MLNIPTPNSDLDYINSHYDFSKLKNIAKFEEQNIVLKNGKKIHCDNCTMFPIDQNSLNAMDELFK